MPLNWNCTNTYFYVDTSHNMMLHQPFEWDTNNKYKAEIDAIGRNFISYYCYNDNRFINGILNCWAKMSSSKLRRKLTGKKYYNQGYRYPTHFDNDMSRDHVIYTILALKLYGMKEETLKEFVDHIRWKISDRYSLTINTWLWMKIMSGRTWLLPLYYLIEIPTFLFTYIWNYIVQLLAGYGYKDELLQINFKPMRNEDKPERVKKFNKLMYPVYALHQNAWKVKLLPNSIWKKLLQKILLQITPKHNYVIKMLLGSRNFSQKDLFDYKSMTTFRWSGILYPLINDRDMRIIKEGVLTEFNSIDVDYAIKLYNSK